MNLCSLSWKIYKNKSFPRRTVERFLISYLFIYLFSLTVSGTVVRMNGVTFRSFISVEMAAVAEAVMDKRAVPLGNETNVDDVEMWNAKETLKLGIS